MTPNPDVSFIVCLYNRLDLTRPFLDSLERTTNRFDWECILVDDVSSDGTREFVAGLGGRYHVVLNESRSGYAANVNRGAAIARAPWLVFLNNDLILQDGWLAPMLDLGEREPRVGAVGNIQVQPETGLTDHAGIVFHRDGSTFHAYKNRKAVPPGRSCERRAVSAACVLVPKTAFAAVGGMDEAYLNGSEDVDFCIRLVLAGYRVLVSHESRVLHHVSASPGRMDHADRNRALLLDRWGDTMRGWGAEEWASEYVQRYARQPWRADPGTMLAALVRVTIRRRWPWTARSGR